MKTGNKNKIRESFIITGAMLIVSAAVYFFMLPSEIIVGSISGLSLVLSRLLPVHLSVSLITLILNALLLVAGFILVGRDFVVKTMYTSMLLPVFLRMFELIAPDVTSMTGNKVFDLCCYIILVATGQAMLFHVNASSGGTDIAAKIISKFTNMEIGRALMLAGFAAAFTSILVYDVPTLIISLLGTYANGLAVDYYINGFNKKKRVSIILSKDPGPIQEYIINKLHRGVTIYEAKGAYDGKKRVELVTVLTAHEYKVFLSYLHYSHDRIFVTVSPVNEIIGQWN